MNPATDSRRGRRPGAPFLVGARPFGGIVDEGWKKHTFLHPKDSGGVLFQLFEEPHAAK